MGADPLVTRLHGAHGNLADGIGILGQALADLAKYIGNAGTSYGNTDTNLSSAAAQGGAVSDYARPMPALGFDPTPGDDGLTRGLARTHAQVIQELQQVLAMVKGIDLTSWQGDAGAATRTLVGHLPARAAADDHHRPGAPDRGRVLDLAAERLPVRGRRAGAAGGQRQPRARGAPQRRPPRRPARRRRRRPVPRRPRRAAARWRRSRPRPTS